MFNFDTSQLTFGSNNIIIIKKETDDNSEPLKVTLKITTKESSSISISQNDIFFPFIVNIRCYTN